MTTMPATYRRAPNVVFRWLRGAVLVAAPKRANQRLEGGAALVWMVLDNPGTADAVRDRVAATWPELGPVDDPRVLEALTLLVDAELLIVG